MGHEQRAATSSTVTDQRRKNFFVRKSLYRPIIQKRSYSRPDCMLVIFYRTLMVYNIPVVKWNWMTIGPDHRRQKYRTASGNWGVELQQTTLKQEWPLCHISRNSTQSTRKFIVIIIVVVISEDKSPQDQDQDQFVNPQDQDQNTRQPTLLLLLTV